MGRTRALIVRTLTSQTLGVLSRACECFCRSCLLRTALGNVVRGELAFLPPRSPGLRGGDQGCCHRVARGWGAGGATRLRSKPRSGEPFPSRIEIIQGAESARDDPIKLLNKVPRSRSPPVPPTPLAIGTAFAPISPDAASSSPRLKGILASRPWQTEDCSPLLRLGHRDSGRLRRPYFGDVRRCATPRRCNTGFRLRPSLSGTILQGAVLSVSFWEGR